MFSRKMSCICMHHKQVLFAPVHVHFRNFGTPKISFEDIDRVNKGLQQSYAGVFPRLAAVSTLLDPNNFKLFNEIKEDSTIKGSVATDRLMRQLVIFADLQNPLLAKYKFDIKEFMVGSKYAIKSVLDTLIGKDLYDNLENCEDNTGYKYLQSTMHPQVLRRKIALLKMLKDANLSLNMEDEHMIAHVEKVSAIRVTTEMVPAVGTLPNPTAVDSNNSISRDHNQKVEGQVKGDVAGAVPVVTSIPNTTNTIPENTPNSTPNNTEANTAGPDPAHGIRRVTAPYAIKNVNAEYPAGSVLVSVKVYAYVKFTHVTPPSSKYAMKEQSLFRSFTFRGCVSEHQETDWKIIDML